MSAAVANSMKAGLAAAQDARSAKGIDRAIAMQTHTTGKRDSRRCRR